MANLFHLIWYDYATGEMNYFQGVSPREDLESLLKEGRTWKSWLAPEEEKERTLKIAELDEEGNLVKTFEIE